MLKLTQKTSGDDVYVNPEHITAMWPTDEGTTRLTLLGVDSLLHVTQGIETIVTKAGFVPR